MPSIPADGVLKAALPLALENAAKEVPCDVKPLSCLEARMTTGFLYHVTDYQSNVTEMVAVAAAAVIAVGS